MSEANPNPKKIKEFKFPVPMYYVARFFDNHPKLAFKLSKWESRRLRKKMEKIEEVKPIYVTGFARAGTTITVEMIGDHPEVGKHRYLHAVCAYIPHWIQKIANVLFFIFRKPVHRVHKDRVVVNRNSHESIEESLWNKFFDDAQDEKVSNIFSEDVSNPEFENFYPDHIKKLLINQKCSSYVTKNNYALPRLEYILKMLPAAKFIIMVRHPINHIASLVKQDAIITQLEADDERLLHWTKIIGHREFGTGKIIINVDTTEEVEEIRRLWSNKSTYVEGWAIYWTYIYKYIDRILKENENIAKASLLVRYEDLTSNTEEVIDQIFNHLELPSEALDYIKNKYKDFLKPPTYYKPSFTKEEIETIEKHTKKIAKLYGY